MGIKRKSSGIDGPISAAIDFADSISERPARKGRKISTNPDKNPDVLDSVDALRASPDRDGDLNERIAPGNVKVEDDSSLSELSDVPEPPQAKTKSKRGKANANANANVKKETVNGTTSKSASPAPVKSTSKSKVAVQDAYDDPEAEGGEEATEEEVKEAINRPPPVHSDYLPLPWKGRLGYACLNTYLRMSNPPVFCSRTCRIASILEHRHPLRDPTQPEHAIKNRPDRDQPASIERGEQYLQDVCLANVRDLPKMIRWNDRYGIKFMRLSSEMFPFASHEEYGYKLAPFASEALAEAGKVIAELGHRVTTHPGQFTQLGSPRKSVIDNAIRDLDYHDEMLSLLRLPEQQNRDAVMILHMGGVFGDKEAAMQRFRENYAGLSQSVKNRLVLENDDVSYNVHELLPICEELNIPLVLDFHHHNILFDPTQVREGTADVVPLFPRILATWKRKGITPKMHYSEPTPEAITPRQRRKHNPRVSTLPPCPDTMDLMIEAKDKEQAVFQLMRDFKLPGWDRINDITPYVREDDNKATLAQMAKKPKKLTKKALAAARAAADEAGLTNEDADTDGTGSIDASFTGTDDGAGTGGTSAPSLTLIPDEEIGMGGPQNRVFWPVGMEEWLRPKKRIVKPKPEKPGERKPMDIEEKKKQLAAAAKVKKENPDDEASQISLGSLDAGPDSESDVDATPATKKAKKALRLKDQRARVKREEAEAANGVSNVNGTGGGKKTKAGKAVAVPASAATDPKPKSKAATKRRKKSATPEEEEEEEELEEEQDDGDEMELDGDRMEDDVEHPQIKLQAGTRNSARAAGRGRVSYEEKHDEEEL